MQELPAGVTKLNNKGKLGYLYIPDMKDTEYNSGAIIIGGDFQGLGIVRDLAHLHIPVIIIDSDFCISRYSKFVQQYYKCPPLTSIKAFTDFLVQLAVEKNLEKWVIFPTTDRAVYILSTHKDYLSKYYLIPTSKWEVTKYAYNKKLTYQLSKKLDLPIPQTFFPENIDQVAQLSLDFPVILKPAIQANFFPITRRKAIQVNDKNELLQTYKYMTTIIDESEIMVQELIRGGANNLYSFCSLFSDGIVKAKIMAKRPRQHPMDFGNATTFAVTCEIPELEDIAVRILKEMNYYGLSEVEFMYDSDDKIFKLLEMNARTWGWHTLGSKAGVNFSSLLFMDMNNEFFSTNTFEKNVKWIRILTDVPTVLFEILKTRLTLTDYFNSIRGEKQFAVYSNKDPLPFVMEVLLAPYFWNKRRF